MNIVKFLPGLVCFLGNVIDNLLFLIQAASIGAPSPSQLCEPDYRVGQIVTFEICLFILKDRYFVSVREQLKPTKWFLTSGTGLD